mmetsp:Transcript_53872/g.100930  ORF Transcript_53872/g.100930 Transcript_53872/m.100930 type:complete len:231 (-) Transcript_53872:7-699(-)
MEPMMKSLRLDSAPGSRADASTWIAMKIELERITAAKNASNIQDFRSRASMCRQRWCVPSSRETVVNARAVFKRLDAVPVSMSLKLGLSNAFVWACTSLNSLCSGFGGLSTCTSSFSSFRATKDFRALGGWVSFTSETSCLKSTEVCVACSASTSSCIRDSSSSNRSKCMSCCCQVGSCAVWPLLWQSLKQFARGSCSSSKRGGLLEVCRPRFVSNTMAWHVRRGGLQQA